MADAGRNGHGPGSWQHVNSRPARLNSEPPQASRGSGAIRASGRKAAIFSHRSMAGSPRASIPPTSKRRRRCSTSWREPIVTCPAAGCERPLPPRPDDPPARSGMAHKGRLEPTDLVKRTAGIGATSPSGHVPTKDRNRPITAAHCIRRQRPVLPQSRPCQGPIRASQVGGEPTLARARVSIVDP